MSKFDHIMQQPDRSFLLSHPLHFLSLGLGTGLSPRAPGTVGTLLGFPLFMLIAQQSFLLQSLLLLIAFLFGIVCCEYTGKALGVSDHGAIVLDEIVAMAWVMTTIPWGLGWAFAAFLLFRLFDIFKPFPIGWVDERVKGGLGVMLDDLLAAGYAIIILQCFKVWVG